MSRYVQFGHDCPVCNGLKFAFTCCSCYLIVLALRNYLKMSVILETTIGDLVIDLFTDERPRGEIDTAFSI